MALKTFKPYTKSSRGTILIDRTGLWKGKPFKSLLSPKNPRKGRNNYGRITARNRAGGHKKMYREVDFYRKKFDAEATVQRKMCRRGGPRPIFPPYRGDSYIVLKN